MSYCARDLEQKGGPDVTTLLGHLDGIEIMDSTGRHWTDAREDLTTPRELELEEFQENGCCTFLVLAIKAGLRKCVKENLKSDKALIPQKRDRPLFDYALKPKRYSSFLSTLVQDSTIEPQMVQLLLDQGSGSMERLFSPLPLCQRNSELQSDTITGGRYLVPGYRVHN